MSQPDLNKNMKLETLTGEHAKIIVDASNRAVNLALHSGDEFDVEQFQEGIDLIYSMSNFPAPLKICVDSPLAIQHACLVLRQVPGLAGPEMWNRVGAQIETRVREWAGDRVGASHQVAEQAWDLIRTDVFQQVRGQVAAHVGDRIRARGLISEPFACVGLGSDSLWTAFYRAFVEIGTFQHDLFERYCRFLMSGVWNTVLLQGIAIGCRRPCFVAFDVENRLHSSERSAIAWRDGFELYYLNGVCLERPEWQKTVDGTGFVRV